MGKKKTSKGPVFVRYFGPILDALRALGGSGRPSEIIDLIAETIDVPAADQEHQLKSGVSRYNNQVQWGRFYLVTAGLIDSSRRGVWTLTPKGEATHLSHEDALAVFRQVQGTFTKAKPTKKAQDTEPPDDKEPAGLSHREALLEILRSLPPDGFEKLSQRLLRECGFQQVTVTGRGGDGGIDGHGIVKVNDFVTFPVYFQCKRYKGSVGPAVIRDFRGAMMGRADKGIVITTGTFTADARKEAVRDGVPPIELADGDKLVDMFEKLELGLKPITAYEVDTSFFDQFKK
jgi:restriction system protein